VLITVSVNGEEYTREADPRLLLVQLVRDERALTGTYRTATRPAAAPAWC